MWHYMGSCELPCVQVAYENVSCVKVETKGDIVETRNLSSLA